VILVGQPATGKSSALNALISILNAENRNEVTIKLSKVYPNAMDDLSELFGCVSAETGDWEDGVFTSIFKKAHQVIYRLAGAVTTCELGDQEFAIFVVCTLYMN